MGSPVAEKLHAAGHKVLGLARSDVAAEKLQHQGIEAHRGDLLDSVSIAAGVRIADAVINLAMLGSSGENFDADVAFPTDQAAAETIIAALNGSGKPFIHTSGAMVVADLAHGNANEQVFDEDTPLNPPDFMVLRAKTEHFVLAAAKRGDTHSIVLRPSHVYGRGGSFLVPQLLKFACKLGVSAYINEGANKLSVVHVDDLADLYVLALERAPVGEIYNAESFEVTMKEVAVAVSYAVGLGGATQSWTMEEAREKWTPDFTLFAATNERITAAKARKQLGWKPQMLSLLKDIEHGSYRQLVG
ncbi:NAD-dependent epimerase/dehydratase family protein [Scytonema sp. NUACC21]